MGLFDRLLGSRSSGVKNSGQSEPAKAKKAEEAFFLDPDASTSMGDVNFMRRSNTIRRTFPGNADSPGQKEMIQEVASMEARLETMTPGLAGTSTDTDLEVNLTGGVPKPVKKTFAQQLSPAQLAQRMKGTAVSVNQPGGAPSARQAKASESEDAATPAAGRAGSIDPFKSMAKDLNS
ncbi:hypothetical protein [Vulcanococcus limneticus]|jgi:hypothetical protein|uniref:hypothetical protein n=1 Tax=Vulcanococcus limneticus TaxID=2170428 RepID=UPI00398BE287